MTAEIKLLSGKKEKEKKVTNNTFFNRTIAVAHVLRSHCTQRQEKLFCEWLLVGEPPENVSMEVIRRAFNHFQFSHAGTGEWGVGVL